MKADSGRSAFERNKKIINAMASLFRATPMSVRQFFWDALSNFESRLVVGVRYCLLAASARSCGENVFIGRRVVIKNIDKLSLGCNVSIHSDCYIDAYGGVVIGNDVSIAHGSSVLSFEHTFGDARCPIKYNPISSSGVKIEDDVWIGCGVRILDGACIESRVVVAAGAVFKGNAESASVYAGVPAKRVRGI